MIGNIYRIYCKPPNMEWEEYHLMPMVEFKTVAYKGNDDIAVKCLVLETGCFYELYADLLEKEGKQVG